MYKTLKIYEDFLMKMRLNFKKFSKHPPTMVGNVYLGSSSHNENYLSLPPCPTYPMYTIKRFCQII